MYSYHFSQESSPEAYSYSQHNEIKEIKRRKRFTHEEDMLLQHLVQIYGDNWENIAAHMNGRNKRQVKERWNSFLSPNLIAVPFSPAEDLLLEEKIKEIGTKWVVLMKYFPNRTDVSLKNRWNMIKRQRTNGGKHQNRKKITPQSSGPAPIVNQQSEQPEKNNDSDEIFSFFEEEVLNSMVAESTVSWF